MTGGDTNTAIKGAGNRMHLQGLAADVVCPQLGPPLDVCRALRP